MAEQQNEITLEDVRKMTDEQRAKITPEQKAKLLEQKAREERIRSVDFIDNESFREFLSSNGYDIVGYDNNSYNFDDRYIHFGSFGGYEKAYKGTDRSLILIGPQSEWDKSMEGFTVKNIVGNPFVKYVDWSLIEFKVYNIVNNPDAEGWGSDEPNYMGNLEKDLSNEWIKFWVLKDQDYVKYILKRCAEKKKEIPKSIDNRNSLLARRIRELQEEAKQRNHEDEKELAKFEEIEKFVGLIQEEKALEGVISLGAKKNWKDNDVVVQHLKDTFGTNR